jgi:tetratricopeptide (TPR) repeat protein
MRGPYSPQVRTANAISILKNPLPVIASLAAGVLSALPGLFDRAGTIRSVGSGLVSESTSWGERLAALAFQLGGWGLAEALRLVFGAVPWFVGFLILFWGASRLKGLPRTLGAALVGILCLVVSAMGISGALFPASHPINDPRLLAPLTLVEMAKSERGRVFMNPSARPCIAPFGEALIDRSLTEKMAADLSNLPEKWRAEDRSKPFSSVLISGRVFEAKPLIQHLLDAPDWYLARVDNQGLFFLRGQRPDLAGSPVPNFPTPRERAVYLAQYALNLEMAGFRTLATASMDEALSLAGKDYEILFRASSLSASQSHWERARKQAAAAAKARPGAYEANYLLALSLLETRAFDKAFECSSKLRNQNPDDPSVLLLHARASRAAHDYSEETKTLDRLLKLAKDSNTPTARIHIFLAQSWAQRGFPEQAISHYKSALTEGLSNEDSRDVRAALATIEDNRLKH